MLPPWTVRVLALILVADGYFEPKLQEIEASLTLGGAGEGVECVDATVLSRTETPFSKN